MQLHGLRGLLGGEDSGELLWTIKKVTSKQLGKLPHLYLQQQQQQEQQQQILLKIGK